MGSCYVMYIYLYCFPSCSFLLNLYLISAYIQVYHILILLLVCNSVSNFSANTNLFNKLIQKEIFVHICKYIFIYIYLFVCLFIYFWLCWVFVDAHGLSLVVLSGGYFLLWCMGFSLRRLLLLWSTGSRRVSFRSCGWRALEHRLSSCGARAQLLRGMWDLPRSGLKPVSPALAGRFLTTAPPGKSLQVHL